MEGSKSDLKTRTVNQWDEAFFKEFVALSHRLRSCRAHSQLHLEESIQQFRELLGPDTEFSKNHHFEAIMVIAPSKPIHLQVVGRIFVSLRTREIQGDVICAGFFESENNTEISDLLWDAAKDFARRHETKKIRTPIQGSFFHSYRHFHERFDSSEKPFFGEPIENPYYTEMFLKAGLQEVGKWHTVKISARESATQFFSIFKRFFKGKGISGRDRLKSKSHRLRVRNVDLKNWDNELTLLHRLLMESYQKMPDFEPIPLAEFKEAYRNFTHLIHPGLVFFLETEESQDPIGFVISVLDPLPSLKWLQRAEKLPNPIRKIASVVAYARLRFPYFGRMLVLYIGKVDRPELEIKGVTGLLGWQLTLSGIKSLSHEALICYLAENSPTYRSLPPTLPIVAEYTLYELNLSREGQLQ